MVKCFNSSKFNLRFLHPLQTLFPSLHIDIFCRIVPLAFIKNSSKFNLKFLHPANAVSSFENWHFLLHRPPYFSLRIWNESSWKNLYPCKRCFLLWKSPFSDASPPTVQDRKFYGPVCKFYGLDCKFYGPDRKFYGPDPISAARNSLCR